MIEICSDCGERRPNHKYPCIKELPSDPVNHPSHYTTHPSGIECIEVTKFHSFCIGNAIKYIWRHEDKGRPVEDLKKAIWYLERQIEIYENEKPSG